MATETDLAKRIQEAMIRLIADVVLFNQAVAQREGLNASDAQFLTLLQVHGPMTPGQLSRETGFTTGATTGVLDRLERAGFVRRTRDERDRRKVLVQPQWDEIRARLFPSYEGQARHLAKVLSSRSAQEQQVILDFLTDLVPGQPQD